MPNDKSDLLEHMDRRDFIDSVKRAECEAAEADASRDTLVVWAKRLSPYLDADPALTIAEAIERYKRERSGSAAPEPPTVRRAL
jgi:hypothetical protein